MKPLPHLSGKIPFLLFSFVTIITAGYRNNCAAQTVTVTPSHICIGDTATMVATPGGGTWSTATSGGIISLVSGGVVGVSAGTEIITYMLAGGGFATAAITVYPTPALITGPSAVCSGLTISLTSATSGGTWSASPSVVATVGLYSGVVSGASAGTIIITYSTGTGCNATETITVTPATPPIVGTAQVCNGSSVTLSNAMGGGSWYSSNPAVATVSSAGLVSGLTPGTTTISYTVGSCPSAMTTLTVVPAPVAISGPTGLCVGSVVTLSNAVPGGMWSSNNVAVATIDAATGTLWSATPGSATITYSLGTGCYATKIISSFFASPILGASSVCLGGTATLSNTRGGGIWSSGNASVAAIGSSSGLLSGISIGTAAITYTTGAGCSSITTITVSPSVPAIAGAANICMGASTSLSDAMGGGTWSSSNTAIAPVNALNGTVTGVTIGSATITYNSGACGLTTASVIVTPLPSPITGASSLCNGQSTTLIETTTGGIWSTGTPVVASVSSSGIVTANSGGTTMISYTLPSGCFAVFPLTVVISPMPLTGTFTGCGGSAISIYDATPGGVWTTSNPSVATITGSVVIGVAPGTAIVTYATATACFVSQTVIVTSACLGMPVAGAATSGSPVVCPGASINLNLSGYTYVCGTTAQWQYSHDALTWTDLPGAIAVPFSYTPASSFYYRCAITCPASGMTAYSTATHVSLSYGISAQYVINTPDTACNDAHFYMSACGFSSSLNVTTWYGDGTFDNNPLIWGSTYHADVFHNYKTPGSYRVKQVLYNGTVAQDSSVFSYQHFYCRTLPIQMFYDANNNCIFDAGESRVSVPITVEVDSNGIPVDAISTTSGLYYRAYGPVGTIYTFRVLSAGGLYVTCPSSGVLQDTIRADVNDYHLKYFGFNCSGSTPFDLSEHVTIQCGRHSFSGSILVANSYCRRENATVTMHYDPRYTFFSADPTPDSITSNTITWKIPNVSSALPQSFITFHLETPWPGAWLTIGDTVRSSYTISPVSGDVDTSNNKINKLDTVLSSYDPNEIFVTPEDKITSCAPLQYTIRFENTGNDTARNIAVLDTLSDNLDVHSLKMVAASAAMDIAILKDTPYTIAKFDFPGINLPDSNHTRQCSGMLVFTIKTKPGLPDGTLISNHAGIVFDDNPVILTNTVHNTIGMYHITGPDSLCAGAGITLSDQMDGGAWSSSNTSATISAAGLVTGAVAGIDTISYTVANSCGSRHVTKAISIQPVVTPFLSVAAAPGFTICAGDMATFTASAANGGTSPLYNWSVNGNPVPATSTTYNYNPADNDSVGVVLTSNATCATPPAVSSSVIMRVLPPVVPSVTITASPGMVIASGMSDTLNALVTNGGPAPLYQWYINGSAIPGATAATFIHSFANRDSVACVVHSSSQCGLYSFNAVYISVNNTGVKTITTGSSLSIIPSPNKGTFSLKGMLGSKMNDEIIIEVRNMLGQTVYRTTATAANGAIDKQISLPGTVPGGTYLLDLRAATENATLRFVIEK
jgi:uncharacterized repeat protein (TIGR01451 family)